MDFEASYTNLPQQTSIPIHHLQHIEHMSNLARTPESQAAWQRIKRNMELRPEELPWLALEKSSKELSLLISGKRYLPKSAPSPIIHSWPLSAE